MAGDPPESPASSTTNNSKSHVGFFHNASDVDARNGVWSDVGRDQYIGCTFETHENASINQLPRAKGAGYSSSNHKTCLPGTRMTVLQEIEKWEEDRSNQRVYWLNGPAGSGKSTIAQTFAKSSFKNNRLGASFFCSRDFEDRRNIRLIFPTLAFQLACQFPKFKTALTSAIKANPDIGEESLVVQLDQLLVAPLKVADLSVTIVVDALDECEDNQPASAILSVLARRIKQIPLVKFFITGRPELPIRSGFRLPLLESHTKVLHLHEVDGVSVENDIVFYLTTGLSEIAARNDLDLPDPWPTRREITAASQKCSGLFVVAYVILKFVDFPYEPIQDRLDLILSIPGGNLPEGASEIDETYCQIFATSFRANLKDDFFHRLKLILGAIVLAFNPLSCASLAVLLGIPSNKVKATLSSLYSVLLIPKSDFDPMRLCHKSLADFVTDRKKCLDKRYYIKPSAYHLELGARCLELMNRALKWNICDLPPYSLNEDVKDLDARREERIGEPLLYACRSWAKHLCSACKDGDDVVGVLRTLKYFIEHQFLSWLEVLSIAGDLRTAIYALHDVKTWLVNIGNPDPVLLNLIYDSERFVLLFFDVIQASATHIYHSALLWSPVSRTRALYQARLMQEAKLFNVHHIPISACTRTIDAGGKISSISFSHNNDLIAVGLRPHFVRIFEFSTGMCLATMQGHGSRVESVMFSPDDALLVSGSRDSTIKIWDVQTGGLVRTLHGHSNHICSVAFSPCGTMIASCALDGIIRIWDITSSHSKQVLGDSSERIRTVHWSRNGKEVISGSEQGTVKVWDISQQMWSRGFWEQTDRIFSFAFSPDSSIIASGSRDRTLKIYDARTSAVLQTVWHDSPVSLVTFTGGGSQISYATQESVFVWDLAKKANVSTFEYQGDRVAFAFDGSSIASGSDDGFVRVWHTRNESKGVPNYDPRQVLSISFSPDGQYIASKSEDGTLRLWDANGGSCLNKFSARTHELCPVTFSPDSSLLAFVTPSCKVQVWCIHTCSPVAALDCSRGQHGFAFSSDNRKLVDVSWDSYIKLWDLEAMRPLAYLPVVLPETKDVRVAFSTDGTSIVVEYSKVVKSWNIPSSLNHNTTDSTGLGMHYSEDWSIRSGPYEPYYPVDTPCPEPCASTPNPQPGPDDELNVRLGVPLGQSRNPYDSPQPTYPQNVPPPPPSYANAPSPPPAQRPRGPRGVPLQQFRYPDPSPSPGPPYPPYIPPYPQPYTDAFGPPPNERPAMSQGTSSEQYHYPDYNPPHPPNNPPFPQPSPVPPPYERPDATHNVPSDYPDYRAKPHGDPNAPPPPPPQPSNTGSLSNLLIRLPDGIRSVSHHLPSKRYHFSERREWVLDQRKRKMCWIPPAQRNCPSEVRGRKVVFGATNGEIAILDFSPV